MKKSIGKFDNYDLYLTIASYRNNNRIYIAVETDDSLYADVTINLSDLMIPNDNYIFVSGDISKELRDFLVEKKIIGEPIETYQYNMGRYDMVKTDFKVLKEYDSIGFKNYEKNKNTELEL